ncbi:MAG: tail fiber domain-containing protein [Cytophagales bacterium]|nr:tail fiber domain-containing protein [Cytophagales bacterium]
MKITIAILLLVFGVTLTAAAQWTTSGTNIFNSNTGNVGIGTSTPSVKLEINGAGALNVLNLINESNSMQLSGKVASNTDFHAPAYVGLRSRGTLASPVDVQPGDRITGLYGSSLHGGVFRNSVAIQFFVGSNPSSTSHPSLIRFETTSSGSTTRLERMRITESGDLGLGTTSPSFKMDVSGSIRAVSFITSSDKRLKTNIVKIENVLQNLNKIGGFTYTFNNDKSGSMLLPEGRRYGFLAQEIQSIFPELVTADNDGYLAVDYVSMMPILVEAIKELKHQLDQVKDLYLRNIAEDEEQKLAKDGREFLEQNSPNPVVKLAKISYMLPKDAMSGVLVVYSLDGNLLNSLTLEKKEGFVEIDVEKLGNGIYLYSMLVNGKIINTKRLLVSR